jgi:hypothetical protein
MDDSEVNESLKGRENPLVKRARRVLGAIQFAGVSEVGLVVAEAVTQHPALPVGGSHVAQLGVVFGTYFIVAEMLGTIGSEK